MLPFDGTWNSGYESLSTHSLSIFTIVTHSTFSPWPPPNHHPASFSLLPIHIGILRLGASSILQARNES